MEADRLAPPGFFDTNVVLYLLAADARRADTAEALLAGGGVVSVQVLNEAASVCRRKLRMPWDEVDALLAAVRAACRVEPVTIETHDHARVLCERYQLSFYDALIVAAAILSGCDWLYSEDLHDGQAIATVRISNPFSR